MTKLSDLISKYALQKHPEGGYFAETYRAANKVISPVNGESRAAVTDIYYLLTKGEISRFHKVLHDEIWHFYEGAPLQIFKYDGDTMTDLVIGKDCPNGYKEVIEGGAYQAAVPAGEYSLVGCTVAPGFDFSDFSFMADQVDVVAEFEAKFPKYKYLI